MNAILLVAIFAFGGAFGSPYGGYARYETVSLPVKSEIISVNKDYSPSTVLVKTDLPAKAPVPIIKHEMFDDSYGNYHVEVKTGDGTSQHEAGKLKDLGGKEGPSVVKEGSYTFTSPEGQTFTVNWKSDENGFQATGDHLPTAPPVPEEILKGIELSKKLAATAPLIKETSYSSYSPSMHSSYY